MRAMTVAHYLGQRVTGSRAPLRERFNELLTRALYRSFGRWRAEQD